MTPIRILVVDDQAIIREGLAALLAGEPGIEVAGIAADGHEAVTLTKTLKPEVVLMDVRMPGMNGIAATRNICAQFPTVKILVLTTFDDDRYVFEALQAGASGYLLKNADSAHLARAIRAVYQGDTILDPAVTGKIVRRAVNAGSAGEQALSERLSGREREVLTLMAQGRANGDIARRLFLSKGTVKNHVSHIIAKLEARDRTHAVRLAVEWGLLNESPPALLL